MPTFQYKALQNGAMTEGTIDAGGRQEAFRLMEDKGLRPISLSERTNGKAAKSAPAPKPAPKANPAEKAAEKKTEKKSDSPAGGSPKLFSLESKKITPRQLENFTRLLSSLLAAGVPLSRALVILIKEAASPSAGAKWKEINDHVVDGMSLADAMAKSPETFPRVYVAMVEAGETGGFLDVVLGQIADFQAREKEMKGKVSTALMYPVILLFLALAVLVFLMVFFIPRFKKIFEGFNATLPLITQVIVAISDFMRNYGIFVAAGVIAIILATRTWLISPAGRRAWEGLMLRLPVLGPIVSQFAMSRFCRMLGTLLGAGVPLINSLNVARRSIGNQVLVDAVSNSIERVKEGKSLGPSLSDCRTLFSGATLEMISVAEESGRLDRELVRIADVVEGDLDRQLKTAVAFAEPLMLFFIAGFVGTIFIGMVLPIFTLQDHIK